MSAYSVQYDLSLQEWDRSHFLEDLSYGEIECAMIAQPEWNWAKSKAYAQETEGLQVSGVSGYALNLGMTEPAMAEILLHVGPEIYKVRKY